MEILVCLKQVPDPAYFSQIHYDPQTGNIVREGIPAIINPLDRQALEEALRIKERLSGRVTVLSMGPPQTAAALQEALAMGADRAYLLCDTAFAGADTLATARTLAAAIRKIGLFSMILCGNDTADGGTAQVGPQLAELLGVPHQSGVKRIQLQNGDRLIVERSLEQGYIKIEMSLPCLLAVKKEINQPRLPTVIGIIEAATKELVTWNKDDLGLSPDEVGLGGSAIRVAEVFALSSGRRQEIFSGPPQEAVKQAVKRLRELGAL